MLWPAWLGLLVVSWLNMKVFRVSSRIQIDGWYFLVFERKRMEKAMVYPVVRAILAIRSHSRLQFYFS